MCTQCALYNWKTCRQHARTFSIYICVVNIVLCLSEIVVSVVILVTLKRHLKVPVLKSERVESLRIDLGETRAYCYGLLVLDVLLVLIHASNCIVICCKVPVRRALGIFVFINFFFCLALAIHCGYVAHVWQWSHLNACAIGTFDPASWNATEEANFRLRINGCTLLNTCFVSLHVVALFIFVCFSKALYDNLGSQQSFSDIRVTPPPRVQPEPAAPPGTISVVAVTYTPRENAPPKRKARFKESLRKKE